MNWIWRVRKRVIEDTFLFLALATEWRLATQCSKEDGGDNRFGKKFKSCNRVGSWLYGTRP